MRKEPEDFSDIEPALVYAARKLRHAHRVEALLTGAGIDYVVETDVIGVGFLFRAERMGAFFYVAPADLERAADVLRAEGFVLELSRQARAGETADRK